MLKTDALLHRFRFAHATLLQLLGEPDGAYQVILKMTGDQAGNYYDLPLKWNGGRMSASAGAPGNELDDFASAMKVRR